MLTIQKNLSSVFYAILSLPSTAMGFALSVQIAALSWILTTQYGLDIHDVGFVWAAGPIAGILGQVIIGMLSDKVWFWGGRRRPFILIGGVFASLGLLALPNIDVISSSLEMAGILGVAITVALALDLSINISFNPTRSIIADVTPEGHERTKGYTWMQTVSGTFGVLAYAIGSFWSNYALIYIGAFLVLVFSVVPVFFVTESRQLAQDNLPSDDKPAQTASLGQGFLIIRPLWGFLAYGIYALVARLFDVQFDHFFVEIVCFIVTVLFVGKTLLEKEGGSNPHVGFQKVLAAHSFTWVGIQSMFIYMVAFLKYNQPDISDDAVGSMVNIGFLILSLVAAILPVLVLQPIAKRKGSLVTHAVCIASMALGYFLLSVVGSHSTLFFVVMALLGIGWSATISLPFAIMSQKVAQSKMGFYMGLFNLSVVLPQLVASLGVGLVMSRAENKNVVFWIAALCLAISAVSWFTVSDKRQTQGREI
ncbi:MFS transporter [Alteromonas sp. a30]|uniref:MFS transporter n=1 Tax=Alteromonas sp. a30 TaxID=2730917 RepID=UPI002282E8F8|nr:MFS transporter [Alteromonas sp. a30]MCY7294125.1 MFS transporter [Alteromonas sp. a30]